MGVFFKVQLSNEGCEVLKMCVPLSRNWTSMSLYSLSGHHSVSRLFGNLIDLGINGLM